MVYFGHQTSRPSRHVSGPDGLPDVVRPASLLRWLSYIGRSNGRAHLRRADVAGALDLSVCDIPRGPELDAPPGLHRCILQASLSQPRYQLISLDHLQLRCFLVLKG